MAPLGSRGWPRTPWWEAVTAVGDDRGVSEVLLCGWAEQPLLELGLALGRAFLDRGMMVQVQPSFGNLRPGAPRWVAVRVGRCYVRERGRQRPRPRRVFCLDGALTGWAARLAGEGPAGGTSPEVVPVAGVALPDWVRQIVPAVLDLVEGGDGRDAGER